MIWEFMNYLCGWDILSPNIMSVRNERVGVQRGGEGFVCPCPSLRGLHTHSDTDTPSLFSPHGLVQTTEEES